MNSSKLEEKILDLRPHYSDKYRAMIEAISNKGEKTGTGNIAQFGAFYQTFMYEGVSKCPHPLFYAQSPDFLKPGLCYFLKFLYL